MRETRTFGARQAIINAEHFNLNENWGDPDKVDPYLVLLLDHFGTALNAAIHISPVKGAVYAEGKGHSDKSWHYVIPGRNDLAMAADVFPECDLFRAYVTALRLPFTGIGVYPYWVYPTKGLQGGLHLDIRPMVRIMPKALWWRGKVGGYRGVYSEADAAALLGNFINLKMRKRKK